MRSMWKGAVSFGLVMIPVKLYTATEQKDIAFRQVHREDGGRIRFRRFCTIDDQEVPYEDIAKGYELPDGEVVVLSEEDMAELPLPTTKSIEVVQFCPTEQLDPILFNRSYYVEPDSAGVRAYCLLRDALEQSGKIAIAQVALRQRESLAVLRARDGVLVLETLLWPDEIRDPAFGFLDDNIDVRPQELRMASSLIDSMTVDFDPDEFHDGYREALQELVAAKIEGREVIQPAEPQAETGEVSSLADALRASLAAAKGGRLGAAPDDAGDTDADEGAGDEAPARRRTGTRSSGGAGTTARSGTARSGTGRSGTARASSAGTAKSSPAKTSAAKAGAARTSTAKAGTAKAGTAKAGPAKSSTAKAAPARSAGTRTAAGAKSGAAGAGTKAAGTKAAGTKAAEAKAAEAKEAPARRTRKAS